MREFCDRKDILLIFDEVITGFRLAPGGGQEYFCVKPDITVLGKILGGGFPVGAFCASKKIMERIDNITYKRPNYSFHGGTFAANPITMTAGLATLRILEDGKVTGRLNKLGDKIKAEIQQVFGRKAIDIQTTGVGSLFNIHFTKECIKDPQAASRADKKKAFDYNLTLIANGVFFLPTHSCALCTAHSEEDLEKLLRETERYARRAK